MLNNKRGLIVFIVCAVFFLSARTGSAISPNSISGSFVVFDSSQGGSACYLPETTQDFCFRCESFTDDFEYVDSIWLRFPPYWIVHSVSITGTPVCSSGTWGSFSFDTFDNEVRIDHERIHTYFDHCVAYYIVNVTTSSPGPDAEISWYYTGDGYNFQPHYPCSDDGYTPAGEELCDEMIHPVALIPACSIPERIYLSPDLITSKGCPDHPVLETFRVYNSSGSEAIVSLSYQVTPLNADLAGPASVSIPDDSHADIEVILTPYGSASPGDSVIGIITASGNSFTEISSLNETIIGNGWIDIAPDLGNGKLDHVVTGYNNLIWSIPGYGITDTVHYYSRETDTWTSVASSAPPFGTNYSRSGAMHASKVFIYGDRLTPGFSGLWSYDLDTNIWTNETPYGTPPALTGIRAPAWVANPETGVLYITGGASVVGPGDMTSVK